MSNILKENYSYNNEELMLLDNDFNKIDKFYTGNSHTIGLNKESGKIYGYLFSDNGQLGIQEDNLILYPFLIDTKGIKVKKVSCGLNHTLLLSDNNEIYSSGRNNFGQCGDGTTNDIYEFKKILSSKKDYFFTKIYCCSITSFAISNNNDLLGWGYNDYGLLLDEDIFISEIIVIFKNVKKLWTGKTFVYALTTNNKLYAWGDNKHYQINNYWNRYINKPYLINFNQSIKDIQCGLYHVLILTEDNKVYSKGSNLFYELGYITNNSYNNSKFIQIKNIKNVKRIFTEHSTSYIIYKNKIEIFGADGNSNNILIGTKYLNFQLNDIKIYGKYGYIYIINTESITFLTSLIDYNSNYDLNFIFTNKIKRKFY